jgi:hypothetical protein
MQGTEARIIDYKSNFMSYQPITIQVAYYSWLIFVLFPHIETVKFQLEFIRYGIKPEARVFTRDDIPSMERYVEQEVLRLIQALESDEWPATVNTGCSYCLLQCPLVKAGLTQDAIGQIQTQEHAEELAGQLYALRMAATRIHANLKNWATLTGSIDAGNDITLGFSKSEKWEHDTKTIVTLNEEHGFDPLRGLKPMAAEVKKISKKYPEYGTRARKAAKDKSSTKFQFKNEVGDPLEKEAEDDE